MRKYIRQLLRYEAKAEHIKASNWIRRSWNNYQSSKVGSDRRRINQAKGTHKSKTWNARVERLR